MFSKSFLLTVMKKYGKTALMKIFLVFKERQAANKECNTFFLELVMHKLKYDMNV